MEKSPLRERASTSVNVTVGRGSRGKHGSRRVNRRCRSCDADMAPTCNPHRACCTAGCRTHRDFVPWRFSAAGRHAAWLGRHPGGRKPCMGPIGVN